MTDPDTSTNRMQWLRRFARDYKDATEPMALALTAEHLRELALAVEHGLHVLDIVWETAAGRKLTEEEKFGPRQ